MRGYNPSFVHPDPEHSPQGRRRVPLNLVPPQLPQGVQLPGGGLVGPLGGGGIPSSPLGDIFAGLLGGGGDTPLPWDPGSGLGGGMKSHLNPHYGPQQGDPTGGLLGGKNDPFNAVWDLFGHAHDVPGFDPTGGYGRKRARPDLRNFGKIKDAGPAIMKWIADSQHKYDPNRKDPRAGLHVDWWQEDTATRPVTPADADTAPARSKESPPSTAPAPGPSNEEAFFEVAAIAGTLAFVGTLVATRNPIAAGEVGLVTALIGGLVAVSYNGWRQHRNLPSDTDASGVGGGSGGPRSNPSVSSGYLNYFPDPETGGPGTPRSRQGSWGVAYMPSPDDSGPGNPRSSVYFPDPETTGPGNPRSRGAP